MSTQTTSITTTQPIAMFQLPVISEPDQSPNLPFEILAQTESMNNLTIAELTKTVESFRTLLGEVRASLDVTLQENLLLKKEIIQQNTKIDENEKLHTAEVKKHTQIISTFSGTVNQLTNNLRLTAAALAEQKKNFEALTINYNAHQHTTRVQSRGSNCCLVGCDFGSTGPSTPYTPEKK